MTQTREDEGLELLGNQQVSYPTDYAPEMLETFQNKHPENDYFVKFNCPEFTSLCPITGQPDFATIYINYVPDERMVAVSYTHLTMARAIELIGDRALTECSGNITRDNVQTYIDLGVDFISSGALTHSAGILDLSMKNLRIEA